MDVTQASDERILCGVMRHAWELWSPPATSAPVYGVREYARCVSCGTTRERVFSPFTGEPTGHVKYVWPGDYRIELATQHDFRKEAHRRGMFTTKARQGKSKRVRRG